MVHVDKLEDILLRHVEEQGSEFVRDVLEIRLGLSSENLVWKEGEAFTRVLVLLVLRDRHDGACAAACVAVVCEGEAATRALVATKYNSDVANRFVVEARDRGLRCVKVHREGEVDIWECCGPKFEDRLTGSAADSKKRRHDRYKVEKRLGLAEYGNEDTRFCDKAKTDVAVGYTRILYGDHGVYLELAPRQLTAYFSQAKIKSGEFYDVVRGQCCEAYFQKKSVAKKETPNGRRADDSKRYRPEGYADYRPGFYYIDLHKLGILDNKDNCFFLDKPNKPPRAKLDRVRATLKHHDIIARNFENCKPGPISLLDRARELNALELSETWCCVQTRLWNVFTDDQIRHTICTLVPGDASVDPDRLLHISQIHLSSAATSVKLATIRDLEGYLGDQKRADCLIPFVPLLRYQAHYTAPIEPRRLRRSRRPPNPAGKRETLLHLIIDTPIFISEDLLKADLLYFHMQLGGVRLALAPSELLRATAAVRLPAASFIV